MGLADGPNQREPVVIIGIGIVKDEADIIETTIRHVATQVDGLIVSDNRSTDGTREILDKLALELPLTVIDDPVVGYYQSQKTTDMLHLARAAGATWCVPFDADEIPYSPHGRIGDILTDSIPAECEAAWVSGYDHVTTDIDPDEPDPTVRMGWRRTEPNNLPKMFVRCVPGIIVDMGNHRALHPDREVNTFLDRDLFVIRHFPYRSSAQFESKARNGAAAYAAAPDLGDQHGTHWRSYGETLAEHGSGALEGHYRKWFHRADPAIELELDGETQPPLLFDPAPVQGRP